MIVLKYIVKIGGANMDILKYQFDKVIEDFAFFPSNRKSKVIRAQMLYRFSCIGKRLRKEFCKVEYKIDYEKVKDLIDSLSQINQYIMKLDKLYSCLFIKKRYPYHISSGNPNL